MTGPRNGKSPVVDVENTAVSGSDFRKAPTDVNRIPGSASSMKVQERFLAPPSSNPPSSSPSSNPSSSTLSSKTAIQAMQPFLDTSTSSSPIQPTDIQLLTTSILSNQQRQRVVLSHQERLIHSNPSLSSLKQSLLFLSSSSWGQVLEERKLAGKCAYPPCTNSSPSSGRGKFRINLRNKSVKARAEVDLAEANAWDDVKDVFCGKGCYARSEWVLRWVLSDQEGETGEVKGKGGVLGGKWEKLTSQRDWSEIELLEDIEREAGVEFGDDAGSVLEGAVDSSQDDDRKAAVKGDSRDEAGKAVAGVSNLLGDLTIVERSKGSSSTIPSTTPYTVDVPNTLGTRFTSLPTTNTNPKASSTTPVTADANDNDDDDEMDMGQR